MTGRRYFVPAIVALLALTIVVFAPVARFGFVSFDDPLYVEGRMAQGLTLENLRWAFTEFHGAAYTPLTLLSHMADRTMFGEWAGGHHLTNLLLHLASTLLLLAFLRKATKAPWPSLFVSALFAVHPLHVEAVAWVAERKELLCTFFELLALCAWVRYLESRSASRYAIVFAWFCLALLSKSMAITFPFLLLLLDYWPLGRLNLDGGAGRTFATARRLVFEKLPLFALLPLVAWLAIAGQAHDSAIAPDHKLPLAERLANAFLSYGRYVADTFFPSRLAAYYVHPQERYSVPLLVLSIGLLAAVTTAVLLFGRRHRFLPVGWFWFLGTLVPVIGLVQVGLQASADRYTYVPLVGLFVMVAWGVREVLAARSNLTTSRAAGLSASAAVLTLAFLARLQVMTWSGNEVLYRRILSFAPECPIALVNLGAELGEQRRYEEAADCFLRASRVTRLPAAPRMNWCFCLSRLERNAEAAECFQSALADDPDSGQAYFQLGFTLSKLQRHVEAMPHYRKALEMKAVPAAALLKIGEAYRTSGMPAEGAEVYRIVLENDPRDAAALAGLAACTGKE